MKVFRKLLSVIVAVTCVVAFTVPVYADGGYIVRTTVETVTTTNGVVTGYDVQTYDSPVQYSSTPCYTAPATTTPTTNYCSSGSSWVPDWGPNYAAEQAKYMKKSSSYTSSSSTWKPNWSCGQPTTYVSNSCGRTIGDEARSRADNVRSYASDHGYSVDVSSDWGDCSYRNIDITVSNREHSRTWTQKTIVNCNGDYETYYERDGHRESYDDVKWYIKDRQL